MPSIEGDRSSDLGTASVAFNARHGLLGLYWFEKASKTVTVNAAR